MPEDLYKYRDLYFRGMTRRSFHNIIGKFTRQIGVYRLAKNTLKNY